MFSKSLVLHGSNGSGDESSSLPYLDANFAERARHGFLVDDDSRSSSVGATLKKDTKKYKKKDLSSIFPLVDWRCHQMP